MIPYDIIGDVHGHAGSLIRLLRKLGYEDHNGFVHPDRRVLFLGDLIDRGPDVREVLQIIKRMVDKGSARVIMGNHEYNIICYFTRSGNGYLRQHTEKNKRQIKATLQSFEGYEKEWFEWLEWLKTFPLYFESNPFRAVHAAWDQQKIDLLKEMLPDGILNTDFLSQSAKKDTVEHEIVEIVLKGQEVPLPDGKTCSDKDGHIRSSIRVKWWENLQGKTYQQALFPSKVETEDLLIPESLIENDFHYNPYQKPLFFGHYWLTGIPTFQQNNLVCLDYSVANGGKLVAYRFDGETRLNKEKFVWVSNDDDLKATSLNFL